MTGPRPTCTRTEQAVGWALHALEPDEEIAVERHVPTCPDCSAAVRDTQAVMAQLATAVEQVDPPARLRASILDAAAATPQVRPQAARAAAALARAPPAAHVPSDGSSRSGPGGPRPPGPQPAGRSRRLSPGRLVVGGGRGIGRRRRWWPRDPHRPAAAADGPVAAAARHRIVAGVQHHRARAGPRPPRQLPRPAGPAGRHGGCGGRPRGRPAHRLHDQPRRQLRRPDLRAVGPQGRLGRPGAARGVRRGQSATPPRRPSALPARSRSAPTRSPWSPAGHRPRCRPTSWPRERSPREPLAVAGGAVLYCRPRWGD